MTDSLREQIELIIRENIWGMVCRSCAGGGMNEKYSGNCSQCDGTGIVDWKYDFGVDKILDIIDQAVMKGKVEVAEQFRNELDVVVCDCGQPYKESDAYYMAIAIISYNQENND